MYDDEKVVELSPVGEMANQFEKAISETLAYLHDAVERATAERDQARRELAELQKRLEGMLGRLRKDGPPQTASASGRF